MCCCCCSLFWSRTVVKSALVLGLAAFTFLAGVIVGVQFFDVHRVGAADNGDRPWQSFVKSVLLPPRLRGGVSGAAAASPLAAPGSAAAAAVSPSVLPEVTDPAVFVDVTAKSAMTLSDPVDGSEFSFFTWIYVDPTAGINDMKTIASNRKGGCEVDAAHRGYSFFVNTWQTSDGALILEWRNSGGVGDGCATLASEPGTIPMGKWVHVGFAFQRPRKDSPGKAMLFLNGELLRDAPSRRSLSDVQRGTAAQNLVLGAGVVDRSFPFVGRMAYPTASLGVISPTDLAELWRATEAKAWAGVVTALGSTHTVLLAGLLSKPSQAAEVQDIPSEFTLKDAANGIVFSDLSGNARLVPPHGKGGVAGRYPIPEEAIGAPAGKKTLKGQPKPPKEDDDAAATAVFPPVAAAGGGGGGVAGVTSPSIITRGAIPGTAPDGSFDFSAGGNQWVMRMIRVPAEQASGSIDDPAALAAGTSSDDVTLEALAASDVLGRQRALGVKAAMQHAWRGYKARAWGGDEVRPRSGTRNDNWAGLGMTLVDSLDTLWVMGMEDEFEEAAQWVATSLNFDKSASVSFFETTIRALGGLLAAYDLSGAASGCDVCGFLRAS